MPTYRAEWGARSFSASAFAIWSVVESVLGEMTVAVDHGRLTAVRAACNQLLLVVLINVPTMSFGLALGWVSLVSGQEGGDGGDGGDGGAGAVIASATTFGASLLGVPLSALALRHGRKFAIIATSFTFIVCWSLKLVGGTWCVVVARAAAGLGAAGAWALAPLLATEMCSAGWRGAASSALVPAYNVGLLLVYAAADAGVPHRRVVWWCLGLAVAHCFLFMLMPESPAFLAARGRSEEAERALLWLRGSPKDQGAIRAEMATLPPAELVATSPFALFKRMTSDGRRARALAVGAFAVAGQEACGVLALLQYAERAFALARGPSEASPQRHALLLAAAQLAASFVALYLVERPLIVWSGLATGIFLAVGAGLMPGSAEGASGASASSAASNAPRGISLAGIALAAAVAADSAGLQPAPYALLADMFHYEYRSCALMVVTGAACLGNALEVVVFPLAAALGGLRAAIGLAATATLAYSLGALLLLPETKGRTPEEIYNQLYTPNKITMLFNKLIRKRKSTSVEDGVVEKVKGDTQVVSVGEANKCDVTLQTISDKDSESTNL